jgi:hypothetical protein
MHPTPQKTHTLAQKKRIWLLSIGLLFFLIAAFFYLTKGILDEGSIQMGSVFTILGIFWYFVKGKQKNISDEMITKIRVLTMAITCNILLLLSAVLYLLQTRRIQPPFSSTQLLALFIFGTLFLNILLRLRYGKHADKLPF